MTSEDIKNITFERAMRGYRITDVDDFLRLAAGVVDETTAQRDEFEQEKNAILQEKELLQSKMLILAQKVEEYRGQEDTLKTALINAQRMGETVVHEAKQKADALMRDATGKTELLRQQAEQEIQHEKHTLEMLQNEVGRFKATVLSFYKQHIESMSALDGPSERASKVVQTIDDEKEAKSFSGSDETDEAELINARNKEIQSLGSVEPEIPNNKTEAAHSVGISTDPQAKTSGNVNLFEGVPLERK